MFCQRKVAFIQKSDLIDKEFKPVFQWDTASHFEGKKRSGLKDKQTIFSCYGFIQTFPVKYCSVIFVTFAPSRCRTTFVTRETDFDTRFGLFSEPAQ